MQRLLVIRSGAIGDVILTLPAIAALRQAFPQAYMELLGNPQRMALAQHPRYAQRVTDLESWDIYRLFSAHPAVSNTLAAYLRTFDLILSYLPMPDETFPRNLRHYCPGSIIAWPPHPPPGLHTTEHLLQPVCPMLQQPCDPAPRVYVTAAAHEAAAHFWQAAHLPEQGVVALHPGSGGRHKLWPVAGWQQVIAWMTRQGLTGLLIKGPAEQERDLHILETCVPSHWLWVEQMSLPHLAAILAHCQVGVGHDSGITHLAAAVGTTTLALFGPTNPLVWGPRSPRSCVLQPRPPGPLTLENLPPQSVIETLNALLAASLRFQPSRVGCTILHP